VIAADPIATAPIAFFFEEEEIVIVGDTVYPILYILEGLNSIAEFERTSQETEFERFDYITGFEGEI
jgi:hypothetical protein